MAESWQKRGGDGGYPMSAERLQSLTSACIAGAYLIPLLDDLNSTMSRDLEDVLFNALEVALKTVLDSTQNESYFELLLTTSAAYIPCLTETELSSLRQANRPLLTLFARISASLRERAQRELSGQSADMMDLDDDFDPHDSQKSSPSKIQGLARRDVYLEHTPEAFYLETTLRLRLLEIIHDDEGQIGLIPEALVDQLVGLSDHQLMSCRCLMQELLTSDLNLASDDAIRIVETVGALMNKPTLPCCEVALCTCIDVMAGLISTWTNEDLEMSQMVGDLYHHLVKQAIPNNIMSPNTQVQLSSLLFQLLEVKPQYATDNGLPSSRSTLFTILKDQGTKVKYFISKHLPKIFGLFVLKGHDTIFVDILSSLPSDPENTEGIAFRLFVLADLACYLPTLLRRCIYHIFETPGRIVQSTSYATACLARISKSLDLDSPQELFKLFAPQLLYTWLEADPIQDIPYEIFGFSSLNDLATKNKSEAAAIMIMRGQEQEAVELAKKLDISPAELVEESFTKMIAYSVAHDISIPPTDQRVTGESRMRKLLGKERFLKCLHFNFADIMGTFFDIFDQENAVENSFRKDERLVYAANVMDEIKKFGYLDTHLPPNQQPMFKGKFLAREIMHVCSRTPWEVENLWTPALVVSIARRLLNTVHPALGPLHACSVVRKIRVLVCLAGPVALASYPLEMLLNCLRPFIVDSECADDALGISQYLIHRGSYHLRQAPTFLAGYALSTLADLRVFLESSQASTTQESQFKTTKGRAQLFHSWFAKYLSEYESATFRNNDTSRSEFSTIIQSASQIRASGNAEKGTHESSLLLEILRDSERQEPLLNEPARKVALSMLCGIFKMPVSTQVDVIETDEDALRHGVAIWKSCKLPGLSDEYLTWAGRVVGRYFAASGEIPPELLRESRLDEYRRVSFDNSGSEEGLLNLIEELSLSSDCHTAGLAEASLRAIVSDAIANGESGLIAACQKSISEALFKSSDWTPYNTPPSDSFEISAPAELELFHTRHLESHEWSRQLALYLSKSVPEIVALSALPSIITSVAGFAEKAFPFIVHLVLLFQLDKAQEIRRQLSDGFRQWLQCLSPAATNNLELLINTILYLRTQPLPNESSIADRSHWLDINFSIAAEAATRCGMFRVAVLFAELASSENARASRRTSAARDAEEPTEILLKIFENIDDPDAYYGITQDASLATVLSRLEYENDGSKSLAFRGAQYDSHLRQRDPASELDEQALVRALSSLGLSGLSNSLLQAQQNSNGSSMSTGSMYTTARRLELWNLPVPQSSDNSAATLYKAYKSIHQAADAVTARESVHHGLRDTIVQMAARNLNTPVLRHHLASLATLTEIEDLIGVSDQTELQGLLVRFKDRSRWMMSGRYDFS